MKISSSALRVFRRISILAICGVVILPFYHGSHDTWLLWSRSHPSLHFQKFSKECWRYYDDSNNGEEEDCENATSVNRTQTSFFVNGSSSTSSSQVVDILNFSTRKKKAKNESVNTRPILILHIGLPKTATTHLQCQLCGAPERTEGILLKDQFVYLGTCPWTECCEGNNLEALPPQFLNHLQRSFFISSHPNQLLESKANPVGAFPHGLDPQRLDDHNRSQPKLQPNFIRRIKQIHRKGHNGIIIFEGCESWSHVHIRELSLLFLNPKFQVHVVVGYRPLYDWLPSKYNSIIKPPRNRAARIWPGHFFPLQYRAAGHNAPNMKLEGEEILPFALENRSAGHSPFLQRSLEHDNMFGEYVHDITVRYQMHPTHIAKHNFERYFGSGNSHILDLSSLSSRLTKTQVVSVDPLLEYLFCDMLPQRMPNTCREIRRGTFTKPEAGVVGNGTTLNPSVNLNYDRLAVEAFRQGLIPVKGEGENARPSREEVTAKIQQRQEEILHKSGNDFAFLTCLDSNTLNKLENWSWIVEKKLFFSNANHNNNNNNNQQQQQQQERNYQKFHKAGFAAAVAKGKFCSIDAKKTLREDHQWRHWFVAQFSTQNRE